MQVCELYQSDWSLPVFPLRPYVVNLVQHIRKLAQQILWNYVKKMPYSVIKAIVSIEAIILAQELPPFCKKFWNWLKLKNLRGNTGTYLPIVFQGIY